YDQDIAIHTSLDDCTNDKNISTMYTASSKFPHYEHAKITLEGSKNAVLEKHGHILLLLVHKSIEDRSLPSAFATDASKLIASFGYTRSCNIHNTMAPLIFDSSVQVQILNHC